jgi:hypothetical protein
MQTHRLHSLCNGALHGAGKHKCPPHWSKDCGIARRCKLFLGTELERGALVQEDPFVWPPGERRREFAAANLQAVSYLGSESTTRDGLRLGRTPQAALTAKVLTLSPAAFLCATSSILIFRLRGRWANGSRYVVGLATDARCMAFSRPLFCAFDDRTLITSRPDLYRQTCLY